MLTILAASIGILAQETVQTEEPATYGYWILWGFLAFAIWFMIRASRNASRYSQYLPRCEEYMDRVEAKLDRIIELLERQTNETR